MADQTTQQPPVDSKIPSNPSVSKSYESYTVQRYNETVTDVLSHRKWKLMILVIFSGVIGLVIPGGTPIQNGLDVVLLAFKLIWLIPVPLLAAYFLSLLSFEPRDFTIDVAALVSRKGELAEVKVIYTIVTRGPNIDSVESTVGSVPYWIERVSRDFSLDLKHELWIITEADSYRLWKERYDEYARRGARILAVPEDYQSRNRTRFKARALQYATELRRSLGFNTSHDWIYHQDEETTVGEDTVLGIIDFIINSAGRKTFGAGTILYPQAWENNLPSVEEFSRSSLYDFSYLRSMKEGKNTAAGYHGSHFLTRADLEDQVGWDFGPNTLTEDGIFAARILHLNADSVGILRGFAYEQPPLTVQDLLKQRRRWILGGLSMLRRSDLNPKSKLPILAGLIVWFSALPAMLGLTISLLNVSRGQFLGMGFIVGFLGYSIYDIYQTGYDLNRPYIATPPARISSKVKLVVNCIFGLIADSVAPWYAILRRTSAYEGIKKGVRKPSIRVTNTGMPS